MRVRLLRRRRRIGEGGDSGEMLLGGGVARHAARQREGKRGMDEAEIAQARRPWRAANPQASWDEIETEGQRQLAGLQAAWMAQ